MKILALFLLSTTALLAQADSKSDADLRARVAATEATLANRAQESRNNTMLVGEWATFLGLAMKFIYDAWTRTQDHRWAKEDADRRSKVVLNAVAEGQQASVQAVEQANHLTQKIVDMRQDLHNIVTSVVTIPDTGKILADMVSGRVAVSEAEIGAVLEDMRKSAVELETYAHKNVHNLNNAVMILQAEAFRRAGEAQPPDGAD